MRLLAAGATSGLLVLALAAPAAAAGSITSPSGGTTVESHTGVDVRAVVQARSADTELRLRDPLGIARTVATAPSSLQDRTLSYVFDTSCPDYPGAPCSGSAPVRNGTWRVELVGGAQDSRELVVRVPPRAPTEVTGQATGPREVVLTWRRGAEPDLSGYVVVDADGREVSEVGLGACEAPTCRHVVAYDEDGPSTEVLAVRARRSACPDCGASLTSASSQPVTVERPAGPPGPPLPGASEGPAAPGASPRPSGSATPRPSTSPSPSASAQPLVLSSGGTGTADGGRLSFGGPGGLTAGGGVADLPALSGQVDAPVVAPLDDTTFDPELPYGAVPLPETAPDLPVQAAPGARERAVDLVDDERAARALAASLLLLLGAAHALRWLRSAPPPVEP